MGTGRKWVDRSLDLLLGPIALSKGFKAQAKHAKSEPRRRTAKSKVAEHAKIANDQDMQDKAAVDVVRPSMKRLINIARNRAAEKITSGKMKKHHAKKQPIGIIEKLLVKKKPSGIIGNRLSRSLTVKNMF